MQNQHIWDKLLSFNEKIIYEFSIGDRYRIFNFILWLLVGLPLIALGVFPYFIILVLAGFYSFFYFQKANAYAFTNKRVLIHKGWLSTKFISVDYDKITDISVEEKFLDKFFTHTGTLKINTAGSSNYEIYLDRVDEPYKLKKKLDEIRK